MWGYEAEGCGLPRPALAIAAWFSVLRDTRLTNAPAACPLVKSVAVSLRSRPTSGPIAPASAIAALFLALLSARLANAPAANPLA